MLARFARLPFRERGSTYLRSFGRHRCDMLATGLCARTAQSGYDFDNSARHEDALVFQYTVAGEGVFIDLARAREDRLTPGKAFLIPLPSETRYTVRTRSAWEFVYLYFTGDLARYHVRRLVNAYGYLHDLPSSSRPVDLLIDLHTRCSSMSQPDEFLVSELLYQLLMELYRHGGAATSCGLPEEIDRARRHIEEHLGDPSLSVELIARTVGYSKYHFSRLFKTHVGRTPHAYLTQVRMRRALELITTSRRPIKEIARTTGFRDYAYFCNAFRRQTGLTPGTARRGALPTR